MKGMNYKVFNDAVHGVMAFHPLLVKLIDTPEVQRLRNIKQLGLTYYVYPAASHNRFEHSLGTCHMAGQLLDALERTDLRPESRPTEQEKLCVLIAALCHDLGHGPFSHTWERFLKKSGVTWKHEETSLAFIDRLYQSKGMKEAFEKWGLTPEHVNFIKNLVQAPKQMKHSDMAKKYYLSQIVSNNDYDVDVDKWDYILRDQKQLNISNSFNPQRLLHYCQVLPVRRGQEKYDRLEICFRDKEIDNLYDMLIARASLHQKAYQHHVVKIIELMLVDALVAADRDCNTLKLTDTSTDSMIKLTDALFYQILHSDHVDLQRAKKILQRIEKRELYQHAKADLGEIWHDFDQEQEMRLLTEKADNLFELCKQEFGDAVHRDEFEIVLVQIDMGSKYLEQGPNCFVYKKESIRAEKAELINSHIFAKNLKPVLKKSALCLYKGELDLTTTGQLQKFVR